MVSLRPLFWHAFSFPFTPSAENHFQSTYLYFIQVFKKSPLNTDAFFQLSHWFQIFHRRTYHIHLVILYICLLELKYLNLGLLSLALGKEPLEQDWVQVWIKPVHQRASVLPVLKLGPTWTKKHQATLESKKSNFDRVRILLTQTNLFTYMHTVKYAMRMIPNEIRHSQSFCRTSKSVI